MVTRRWILTPGQINGSSCTHDCFVPNPPPSERSPTSGHRFLANAIIGSVSGAAVVFFLVLTYYTILVRRRRTDRIISSDNPPLEPDGAEVDYHVWHARTVGLDESTINSIPVKPYISGGRTSADCSVCIGEFRDGELIRLLPGCDHAFHVPCIDTWLRAHINCPLCRTNIIDSTDSGEGGLASVVPEGSALTRGRSISVGLEEDDVRGIRTVATTDSSVYYGETSMLGYSSDFASRKLQRRSNSMDSLRETDRGLVFQEEKKEQEQIYSDDKKGEIGDSFKENCFQKSSEEIGGSSSSGNGRMFFFSRYGRTRSSSVLPV